METAATVIKPPLYVVQITGRAADGAVVKGTGFVVDQLGHVATCRHVVFRGGQALSELRVQLPHPAPVHAYHLLASSSDDLAILSCSVPLRDPVPMAMLHDDWTRDTHVGDDVSVWGYSAPEHYTQAQRLNCTISGLSEINGRVGLNGSINPGDSGAPLLDGRRRVIGVAQVRDQLRSGQAMAIPVSLLQALLRQCGVQAGSVADTGSEAVFDAPYLPDYSLVGREPLIDDVKQRLLAGRDVALCFKPGVGKSALATALANDQDLRAHFDGGVLWASLNLAPDVLSELKKWGVSLSLTPERIGQLDSLAAQFPSSPGDPDRAAREARRLWADALAKHIGQRRMLLVADDAWQIEPVKALLLPAPRCAYLVTTREQVKVADMLGPRFDTLVVDELTENDGVAFLRQLAPRAVEMFPDEARALFRAVGGLPQGLLLLGMELRKVSHDGRKRRIEEAYQAMRSELPKFIEPLHGAIQISYGALPDDETRRALQALSIFRPKPSNFMEDAALAVLDRAAASDRGASLIDRLSDAGLLETDNRHGDSDCDDPPYTMHRTIAEFAQQQCLEAQGPEQVRELHRRAAVHYATWLKEYEKEEHEAGSYGYQYRYENARWQDAMDDYLYHLARAGDPGMAILDFGAIYFNAFWWWGCYVKSPFCTRLLEQAAAKSLSPQAREALDLLVAFDSAYPKETQRAASGDWNAVWRALTTLRAVGALDGAAAPGDTGTRYTRALTDIFLAEAERFGRHNLVEAERLYQDALAMLPDADWSRPWVHYHLGDLYLQSGRDADARAACRECLALAEDAELALKDRDNEVIANAWRLHAALAERDGDDAALVLAHQRAVLHAYGFQAVPEPPDDYTVAFYLQVSNESAQRLQALHRVAPARALQGALALRAYWAGYRVLAQIGEAGGSEAELDALLRADAPEPLSRCLFPAAPPHDAKFVRGSRYFNEAIMILNEKMGHG